MQVAVMSSTAAPPCGQTFHFPMALALTMTLLMLHIKAHTPGLTESQDITCGIECGL